jgi:hypothetical protein
VTLDGLGATRLFRTTYQFASFTLTFRNLAMRNGRAPDYGGAIRLAYQDFITTLNIEGVTFTGNVCDAAGNDVGGGALYAQGGIVTIRNSSFSGNRGGNGGAIGNLQARFTIEDTTFTGNSTNPHAGAFGGSGGAIYIDGSGGGQLVIRRSAFVGNAAAWAAGAIHTYLYAGGAGMTIEDSTFDANSTYQNGGAIYHQNGALTVARSTFSNNTTRGQGGAIWLLEATPTSISNSTFSGNAATGIAPNSGSSGLGGAILINAANAVTISHTTIANNHADWVGGGITGGMSNGSSTTLRGTIVAHNTAANGGNPWNIAHNCSTQLLDGGGNLQFPTHANPGDPNDPNCTAVVGIGNPLLGPLAGNGGLTQTRALLPGSPARNRVTSGCPPPSTDQRGVTRPQGGACDAGSYEATASISASGTEVTEGTGGATVATFTLVLSEANNQPVTVAYQTVAQSAGAGSDFVPASGTLTFPPGSSSRTLSVSVIADAIDELDESFRLGLSNPVNATLGSSGADATIDDDDGPTVSVSSPSVVEENAGTAPAIFTLSLSAPSVQPVTVPYVTADGTASAGQDYQLTSGTVTFPAGTTGQSVNVPVTGDVLDEPNETFYLSLGQVADATPASGTIRATIQDDDGGVFSLQSLGHGADRRETLQGGADLFVLHQPPRTSWEVRVDGASGDVGTGSGPRVERVAADLTTILQSSSAAGAGPARTLRWTNAGGAPQDGYMRVTSAGCGTDCGTDDVYRLRALETTGRIARFNASGGQVTVLVLQNATSAPLALTAHFWSPAGTLLGTQPLTLPARAASLLNCASVPGAAGQSGSITVVHDGGYGALAGKAVSLDPAGGFSFDTPLTYRPR